MVGIGLPDEVLNANRLDYPLNLLRTAANLIHVTATTAILYRVKLFLGAKRTVLIDNSPASGTNLAANNKALAAQLSAEMTTLLAQLKLRVGQTVQVEITKLSSITAQEKQILLDTKTPRGEQGQQWRQLITDPQLRLAEVRVQGNLFYVLTKAPVKTGNVLLITLKNNHTVLNQPPPTAKPEAQPTLTVGLRPATVAGPANQNSTASKQAAPGEPGQAPSPEIAPAGKSSQTRATNKIDAPFAAPTQNLKNGDLKPVAPALTTSVGTPKELPTTAKPPQQLKTDSGAVAAKATNSAPLDGQKTTQPGAPSHQTTPASQLITLRTALTQHQQQAKELMASSLRESLPRSTAASGPIALIQQSSRAALALPSHTLPPSLAAVFKALQTISMQPMDLRSEALPTAQQIRAALSNSGLFLEQKLSRILDQKAPMSAMDSADIAKDLKATLLHAQSVLNTTLTQLPQQELAKNTSMEKLWQQIFNLLPTKPAAPETEPAQKALTEILNQVQKALANIQLRQNQSLNAHLPDAPTNAAQLSLDVLLRMPDGFFSVFMQLFNPELEKEKQKQREEKQRKQARWKMFMALELGDLGQLSVELGVTGKQMDATFWADNDRLRQSTEAELSQLQRDLEQRGLEVQDLRCSQNPPPSQAMHMGYALVDEQT